MKFFDFAGRCVTSIYPLTGTADHGGLGQMVHSLSGQRLAFHLLHGTGVRHLPQVFLIFSTAHPGGRTHVSSCFLPWPLPGQGALSLPGQYPTQQGQLQTDSSQYPGAARSNQGVVEVLLPNQQLLVF